MAQIIVAALGVDLERFSTAPHWASGAGRCPGNTESAGQRQSGKTSKGSRYWRAALLQAAWAASHQKGTYLAAQYTRLVRRLGKKKARVAGAIVTIGASSLQTEFCQREMDEAMRVRVEPVPLDEEIERGQRKGKPRLESGPWAMQHFLQMP